ncbi:LOW QUALITY PROTEIN: uncharacterized protein LOC124257808 [Haliotis rubra]|uniref:LOW QUALITY PROTEIN: uncharacterized protein LOC124257808 n=1 Tax=Haliotis rubra TaxID=36100 RepID=UPI001EE535BB|nr:LOW QUALITY PROTEIN: uncharacterized protein LOC124257808 [Haliotis rubra]
MSGVNPGGSALYPGLDTLSKADPDVVIAMDLEYTKRNQKCVSPFQNKSKKSVKSRMSDKNMKKEGTSASLKTRARQIKAHETEPFLSVDTIPADKRNLSTEGSARHSHHSMSRGQSSSWASPGSPSGQRGMSRFSMYSSASVPARHNLTRSSRRGMASSMSQRTLPSTSSKARTLNSHIKSPFKHSVHKPTVAVPPENESPSQDLKDRTALATYHINKMLLLDTHSSGQRPRGKLLKAKLKPLYPVKVQGPQIEHCRGIVADTHSYSASPSKSLQRRKQIMSSMNGGELKDLMDRPRTVESIHRTSVASSVDENRDNLLEEDISQLSQGFPQASSSASSLPSVSTVPSQTHQGISEVTQPSDLASASPIVSPEGSETVVRGSSRDSSRDTSTVFLTSGRNVEALTDDPVSGEVIPPEVEAASREVIQMARNAGERISLLGIDTKDLLEAEGRDDVVEAEKSNGGSCEKMTYVTAGTAQEEHQSGNSSVEGRVRPYSATTQLTQNFRTTETRPLSTGDLSRRKSTSKSVRFADETESPKVEAWNDAVIDKDVSSGSPDSNNKACENEGNNLSSSNQSKSRCKPSEIELGKEPEDPDDDKENYSPKKSVYFQSSQTFSQTLASTSQQCSSNKTPDKTTSNASDSVVRTSFMEEFLAHAAPVDDSVCSVSSEECQLNAVQNDKGPCEDQEATARPFPLISLSERIAAANICMPVTSDKSMHFTEPDKEQKEDEVEEDLEEVIIASDPPVVETFMESDPSVNVTFSSHEMLNQFEHCYGSVNNLIEKPPVNVNRRKKTKGRGTTASEFKKRPFSPPCPPSQRKESNASSRSRRGKSSQSPSKPSSYGVGARHHYPSDLIDSGAESGTDKPVCKTNIQGQSKSRSTQKRPSSGRSVSSYSSQTSNSSSGRLKHNVPNPTGFHIDEEEIEVLTFDDLDHQIDLIQSELKKNIDQQAQLLSETEHLRHSLKSREDFYSNPDKVNDEDAESVWCPAASLGLQSDGYYQSLLKTYRKKCMEVSENCLMISEHITSPRWQGSVAVSGGTGSEEKAAETPENISQNTEGKVPLTEDTSHSDRGDVSEECEEHDHGCAEQTEISEKEDTTDRIPEKADTFLKMLCTTVEEVEQPVVKSTCLEIRQHHVSGKKELTVVATTKELSKQKVKKADKPSAPFPPLCFSINARPPQGYLYYFAYGADMNNDRMSLYLKRDISQRFWGLLMGFSLVFNKKGADVEAGCFPNIEFNPFCSVEGCVYQLTQADLNVLDKCVGVPQHYCHVVLPVWMSNTTDPDKLGVAQYCVPAVIYIAQDQWVDRDGGLSTEYSISQCRKSADLLTPAYRGHLTKLASVSGPALQPATA